ncbi:hypothetical protein RJ639_001601 [Escallonia herrerae]|uniref:GDSL esterase/lipase 1-like n=1 Tax=Escallonia herrerae TaxID=1293975 RepID=A0AA89BJ82_9ASTE|nr:hypothetical protein RJ639_001601 [Escallonia herrerae]
MATSDLHFFALVVLAISATGCLGREHGHDGKRVPFFIFGDSLFDAGNNNYINTVARANFWPYGETFFKYPTGRFCDGRLIPDFIAEYAELPLIPPYLQPGNHQFNYGANFASAGAGALDETHTGRVINLNTQLTYFEDVEKQLTQKLGDEEATQLLSEAVYLFSIGSNDYGSLVNYSGSHDEYVGMVIGNMTVVIKEGKSACCGMGPYRGIDSCGGKRGIAEYKLCTNASEYLFFDSSHPTEAANDQVAKLIWSGNRTIAWPYNLKKLFKA